MSEPHAGIGQQAPTSGTTKTSRSDTLLRAIVSGNTVQVKPGKPTNGEDAVFATVNISELSADMLHKMAARGVALSLRESWVKTETVDAASKEAIARADAIQKGTWTPPLGRRGSSVEPASNLELALMQYYNTTLQTIRDEALPKYFEAEVAKGNMKRDTAGRLHGQKEAKARLEAHPKIAPIVQKIIAEQARKNRAGGDMADLDNFAPAPQAAAAD